MPKTDGESDTNEGSVPGIPGLVVHDRGIPSINHAAASERQSFYE